MKIILDDERTNIQKKHRDPTSEFREDLVTDNPLGESDN
jgi:hypothetical protein